VEPPADSEATEPLIVHLGVFGGTGNTGRHLIEQALRKGHEVTALTKDPGKLPVHPHLHAVTGDVRDEQSVRKVVAGAHAVFSMLGERRWTTTVCTDGIRSILHAMHSLGVRRLLALSAYGVAENRHSNLYVRIGWKLMRGAMQDKERMESLIRASNTNWTVIRPARIINGPHTGDYHSGTALRLGSMAKISFADLASFTLSLVKRTNAQKQVISVAFERRRV
jgi:putative NADH-flavin reductase